VYFRGSTLITHFTHPCGKTIATDDATCILMMLKARRLRRRHGMWLSRTWEEIRNLIDNGILNIIRDVNLGGLMWSRRERT
jgi:hypothetical protein